MLVCREELAAAEDFLRGVEAVKVWPSLPVNLVNKSMASCSAERPGIEEQLSLLKMLLRAEIERLQARLVHTASP